MRHCFSTHFKTYLIIVIMFLIGNKNVLAANSIDLRHQPVSLLHSLISPNNALNTDSQIHLQELNRNLDFNHTLHIRFQEVYAGYLVWGSESRIGTNVLKSKKAVRYVDHPSLDCEGRKPEEMNCSIEHMKDFDRVPYHIPYFTMGIFNKAFYLISTARDWDTKKAYDVMVHANRYYWVPSSTFLEAACGVMKASQDYHYSADAIIQAFSEVGIDINKC